MVDMQTTGERIRFVRKLYGLNQTEFAQMLSGVTRGAVGNWELGKGIKIDNLSAISKIFSVDLDWLAHGTGPAPESAATLQRSNEKQQKANNLSIAPIGLVSLLSVRGIIQAGIWQEVVGMEDQATDPEFTAVPHPKYPISEQFVLAVRGDSMNAATPVPIPDGAFVKCVSLAAYGRDPKDGQIVVVHRFKDQGGLVEATLKKVRLSSATIEFHPESTNPRYEPIIVPRDNKNHFEEIRVVGIVLDVINRIEE